MQLDNDFFWKLRPEWMPGEIDKKILSSGGGFIRPLIKLDYPNGAEVEKVYHYNLSNFTVGQKVLFSMEPASRWERDKQNQPDLMQASEVNLANEEDVKTAIQAFRAENIKLVLLELIKAQEAAREAKSDADKEHTEYDRKIGDLANQHAGIAEQVDRLVEEKIGPAQQQLNTDQMALGVERQNLVKREQALAPYMRAISLPPDQAATIFDIPLPENLAKKWPNLLCGTSGLDFEPNIAIAFLISTAASVFSGSVVLLNGSVGVGKTSLVKQMAQALDGTSPVFPVRPAWIDPSDLLGFFDPINNTFRPTPFTTALTKISDDRLRLLCLDELNLARVENYAADLLSRLEYSRQHSEERRHDADEGKIQLYSPDIQQQMWEDAKDIEALGEKATAAEKRKLRDLDTLIRRYPAVLPFPENAVLVGTLNSDETTYDLSPKMIDRSYVITFASTEFKLPSKQSGVMSPQPMPVTKLIHEINKAREVKAEHWDVLLEWNEQLKQFGIPLGHRVKRDYDIFRAAGAVLGVWEKDCLGYFLFCKILPRIFFFKAQNDGDVDKCEEWLQGLKEDYGDFGPQQVIDNMITMCGDDKISSVRYWSKS